MVTKDTLICEILRKYPLARDILAQRGMSCIGCMASVNETVENAAKMHEVDIEALLVELNLLVK